jgi:diguanylate cyclase
VHPRAWRALALGGVAAVLGYFALAPSSSRGFFFDVLGVLAAAAIFMGVRLNRPAEPLPWHLIAAGSFVTVVGRVTHADLVHLAAYPFFAAGLVILIRQRTGGRDRPGLIDASIISISMGAASWMLLIQPRYHDQSLSVLAKVVAIALPLVDVLFVALAARLLAAPGHRTRADQAVAVAVLAAVAADSFYATLSSGGRLVDAGWLIALVG